MAIISSTSHKGWAQNGRGSQSRGSPRPGEKVVGEGFLEQRMFRLSSKRKSRRQLCKGQVCFQAGGAAGAKALGREGAVQVGSSGCSAVRRH